MKWMKLAEERLYIRLFESYGMQLKSDCNGARAVNFVQIPVLCRGIANQSLFLSQAAKERRQDGTKSETPNM